MRGDVPHAPVILKPHEPVAERVLLPGDPGRALRLATQLLDGPRMLNHHRGLWGYSGRAADGELLTIQSTGLGGPSAAAVVAELLELGARRLIRVGTAAGLGATPLGAIVVAEAALATDGARGALAAPGSVRGLVASVDIHDPVRATTWAGTGALACDLATAAVLAAAAAQGAAAGAILAVTRARGERLADDALEPLESALGAAATAALAPSRAR